MTSSNAANNAYTMGAMPSPLGVPFATYPAANTASSSSFGLGKAYLAIQGISALAGLASGIAGVGATTSEASRLNAQANLILAEARRDAQLTMDDAKSFREDQAIGYLNSGVTISEGSVMEVLSSTVRKGQQVADATIARSKAQAALVRANASQTKRTGMANLFSAAVGAGTTASTAYLQARRLGLLQNKPTAVSPLISDTEDDLLYP